MSNTAKALARIRRETFNDRPATSSARPVSTAPIERDRLDIAPAMAAAPSFPVEHLRL